MERLTKIVGGLAVPTSFDLRFGLDIPCKDWNGLKAVLERLAAYEDTGLMPEEINGFAEAEYAISKHANSIIERRDKLLAQADDYVRLQELAKADKEGRVVVLPCKVDLEVLFERLSYECSDGADAEETYTTGYRCGHRNGQIELLQRILGKSDGTREEAEV